jgi:glutathione S-transferase
MYVLHHVPDWASLVVNVTLAELGAATRIHRIDVPSGALTSPEHLALHPFGKVPVLETPQGPIFETGAILLWLADRHGKLAPAFDAPERPEFLSWFFFLSNTLHTGAMDLLHPQRPAGETNARAVAETAHARLKSQLAVLEAVIVTEQPAWLSGPTVFSYYLSMLLRWIDAFPAHADLSIPSAQFPALHAIARAMETRPAAQRAARLDGLSGSFFSNPKG